jgi:transposase
MANKPIIMSKIRQILKLFAKGIGKKKIAGRLSVSKVTVKHYIDFYMTLKTPLSELEKKTDLELSNLFHPPQEKEVGDKLQKLYEFFPDVEKQLRRRGMTLAIQYQVYKKKYPDGYQLTQFYHYYRLWSSKVNPSMPIQHKSGDKMYIDFTGERLPYVDPDTGEIKQAEVFVAILGWSQYSYFEAVPSQRVDDFIGACENALHYFQGAPLGIVPDNLKSAVIKASKYEPEINENFLAFATHYGTTILPARARSPQDKAHVENMVKIGYQRIFTSIPEGRMYTLEELNELIKQSLVLLNEMLLTGKDCSRKDQWLLELPTLHPLRIDRYEMRQIKQVTVMKNGHVLLSEDKHYYSVPFELIGKKLALHYSRSQVDVYQSYQLIASHKRVRSRGNYSTDPSHMSPQHRYVTEWSPDFFLNKAKAIDPIVELFIKEVLLRKQHPEQAYKSCQGILSFEKRVGTKRLINACKRAHEFGYYTYKIIEDILKKNLDQFDEDPSQNEMPSHDNIRGANYYQ